MGLDNFVARGPDEELTQEDVEAFKKTDVRLCGGILSGPADSFRGKVYSDLIADITGESLYQKWIPPERVKKMYEALVNYDHQKDEGKIDPGDLRFDESTLINLRKFFKVCAERNLGLAGW